MRPVLRVVDHEIVAADTGERVLKRLGLGTRTDRRHLDDFELGRQPHRFHRPDGRRIVRLADQLELDEAARPFETREGGKKLRHHRRLVVERDEDRVTRKRFSAIFRQRRRRRFPVGEERRRPQSDAGKEQDRQHEVQEKQCQARARHRLRQPLPRARGRRRSPGAPSRPCARCRPCSARTARARSPVRALRTGSSRPPREWRPASRWQAGSRSAGFSRHQLCQPGDLVRSRRDDVPQLAVDLRAQPFRTGEDAVDVLADDDLAGRDRSQEGHIQHGREFGVEDRRIDRSAGHELALHRGAVADRALLRRGKRRPRRRRGSRTGAPPRRRARRRRAVCRLPPRPSDPGRGSIAGHRQGRTFCGPPLATALPITAQTHYCLAGCFGSRPPAHGSMVNELQIGASAQFKVLACLIGCALLIAVGTVGLSAQDLRASAGVGFGRAPRSELFRPARAARPSRYFGFQPHPLPDDDRLSAVQFPRPDGQARRLPCRPRARHLRGTEDLRQMPDTGTARGANWSRRWRRGRARRSSPASRSRRTIGRNTPSPAPICSFRLGSCATGTPRSAARRRRRSRQDASASSAAALTQRC